MIATLYTRITSMLMAAGILPKLRRKLWAEAAKHVKDDEILCSTSVWFSIQGLQYSYLKGKIFSSI